MAASNGVRRVFGGGSSGGSGSVGAVLIQNQCVPCSSQPLDTFFFSGSSSSFLGSSSMVSFEDVCGRKRSERSFFNTYDQEENGDGDGDFDDYFHQPEKKRRLTVEQVQFLEKSFEVENKLEPERKIQLAKDLGLQPRQVAIWFQNRRARWKTKQLEKDHDILQASYDSLRDDYDNLLKEKEKLQAEVVLLTDKLGLKEKNQGDHSEPSNIFNHPLKNDQPEPMIDSASESEDHIHHVSIFSCKHEDVLDSDSHSPHRHHVVDADPGESSYAFDADHSDISQDDQDYLSRSLLPASYIFPKIEDVDHQTSLFWPYWDINLKL